MVIMGGFGLFGILIFFITLFYIGSKVGKMNIALQEQLAMMRKILETTCPPVASQLTKEQAEMIVQLKEQFGSSNKKIALTVYGVNNGQLGHDLFRRAKAITDYYKTK